MMKDKHLYRPALILHISSQSKLVPLSCQIPLTVSTSTNLIRAEDQTGGKSVCLFTEFFGGLYTAVLDRRISSASPSADSASTQPLLSVATDGLPQAWAVNLFSI
jgi:hypothetical protein